MIITFMEYVEAMQHQTLGSLYNDLVSQFPDQANRIKGILKDLAPKVIQDYGRRYSRPNPELDAERAKMGLPAVRRIGPELAMITPDQYNMLKQNVLSSIGRPHAAQSVAASNEFDPSKAW